MKIVVMSDNHGNRQTVEQVQLIQGDAYFHCGDSELSAKDPILQSIYCVRGNCDLDENFPEEVEVEIDNNKIWMVHGHRHQVKNNLMTLFYSAKERNANIVLFGHSHLYGAEMKDDILFVNPGSSFYPRAGNPPTYAVIEWTDAVAVKFYTFDGRIIDEAHFNK